jgi:hypothetical protein
VLSTVLSSHELNSLASAMQRAYMDTGRKALALDMMASALDAKRLIRVAQAFGFAPTFEAIVRSAPEKTSAFLAQSNPNWGLPPVREASPSSVFLDYTIEEIYLTFRTAPVGSLSVSASVYMTATVAGAYLITAWTTGHYIGSGINSLINTYAPDLGNAIGEQFVQHDEPHAVACSGSGRRAAGHGQHHGLSIRHL